MNVLEDEVWTAVEEAAIGCSVAAVTFLECRLLATGTQMISKK
jgi:hypothetical protein